MLEVKSFSEIVMLHVWLCYYIYKLHAIRIYKCYSYCVNILFMILKFVTNALILMHNGYLEVTLFEYSLSFLWIFWNNTLLQAQASITCTYQKKVSRIEKFKQRLVICYIGQNE